VSDSKSPASKKQIAIFDSLKALGYEPALETKVSADGDLKSVDITIRKLKICIEYDGYRWHNSEASIARDRAKSEALLNAGWKVIRMRESSPNSYLPPLQIEHPCYAEMVCTSESSGRKYDQDLLAVQTIIRRVEAISQQKFTTFVGALNKQLHVELYGKTVGTIGTAYGKFHLDFSKSTFPCASRIMSFSLPLVGPPNSREDIVVAKHFFESLLPQGENLSNVAKQKGIPIEDLFGLLKSLGSDMAGALRIFDPEDTYEEPYLEPVSPDDIRMMLNMTDSEPLGNHRETGAMSLGGYQSKILLSKTNDEWNRTHNGYPTTHIIKPHSDREELEGLIYCEAYGLDIARAAGVLDYKSWIEDFGGEDALVIERFDRDVVDGKIHLIHQENGLQALGLPDSLKYEMMNHGKISLKMLSKLIRSNISKASQLNLLRTTVVNTAIGNLDAHAGNLGLLHYPDGSAKFAPAYDMVVNSHYLVGGGEQPLALLVGGEYKHKYLSRKALIDEGTSWGVKRNQVEIVVDEMIDTLVNVIDSVSPHKDMPVEAYENVQQYVRNLAAGKCTGAARTMRIARKI
jgi:serine/threonine-protein kinase HipA